jgi:hypothetical protein
MDVSANKRVLIVWCIGLNGGVRDVSAERVNFSWCVHSFSDELLTGTCISVVSHDPDSTSAG